MSRGRVDSNTKGKIRATQTHLPRLASWAHDPTPSHMPPCVRVRHFLLTENTSTYPREPDHPPEADERVWHGTLRRDVSAGLLVPVDIARIHIVRVGVVVCDGQDDTAMVVREDVAVSVLEAVRLAL